jgi:hypothetical protein
MSLSEILGTFNADVMPTTEEITAWNALEPVVIVEAPGRLMAGRLRDDAEDTVTTKVGLFGADLTTFNEECLAADDTDICDPADYVDYNGWGIGVHWSDSAELTTNDYNAVIFEDALTVVMVSWGEENGVGQATVATVTADAPATPGDVEDSEDAEDAFAGWAAAELTSAAEDQFAFNFFEAGDAEWYFEDGDTLSIWTSVLDDASDNVNTADFVLVGAASLTAATSVIVAALLF